MLSSLGSFVQETITTNTAVKLIETTSRMVKLDKPLRNAICLASACAVGGGFVPLFILTPIKDYFEPLVLDALPFVGDVGATIGVGVIGFWIGGALGHNASKFIYREMAKAWGGHTNSAYHFNDSDVEKIVAANPELFQAIIELEEAPMANERDEIEINAEGNRVLDPVAHLKLILKNVRDKIDEHRNDKTVNHDHYKYTLLRALRFYDLDPLMEWMSAKNTMTKVRAYMATNRIGYIESQSADEISGFCRHHRYRTKELLEKKQVSSRTRGWRAERKLPQKQANQLVPTYQAICEEAQRKSQQYRSMLPCDASLKRRVLR